MADTPFKLTSHHVLGLHYAGAALTAVVLDARHPAQEPLHSVRFSADVAEPLPELVRQLGAAMAVLASHAPAVALALGGQSYQSGPHHTDFTDPRQINQTLPFDIEEEFMTDAETSAICYQMTPPPAEGADLLVHLTDKQALRGLCEVFEAAHLDVLLAQPDLAAWTAYLRRQIPQPEQPIAALAWAAGVLYVLVLDSAHRPLLARSTLCPDHAGAADILRQQCAAALASLPPDRQPKTVYYHGDHLPRERIEELADALNLTPQALPESDAGRAFAVGAALAHLDTAPATNFRTGDLQPRTLIQRRQRAFYGLAAGVTILLLATAAVLFLHGRRQAQRQQRLTDNITAAYQEVFPGQRIRNFAQVRSAIRARRMELQAGSVGTASSLLPDSAAQTLLHVISALDRLPEAFDLRIDSIRTGPDYAILSGSVPNLADRTLVDAAIAAQPELRLESWDVAQDASAAGDGASRRTFNMSLSVRPPAAQAAAR